MCTPGSSANSVASQDFSTGFLDSLLLVWPLSAEDLGSDDLASLDSKQSTLSYVEGECWPDWLTFRHLRSLLLLYLSSSLSVQCSKRRRAPRFPGEHVWTARCTCPLLLLLHRGAQQAHMTSIPSTFAGEKSSLIPANAFPEVFRCVSPDRPRRGSACQV